MVKKVAPVKKSSASKKSAPSKNKRTAEQQAIKAHGTKSNMIIMARAGCGKSTTLRDIASSKATILCFNRAPADEMQAKLTNGASANTFHSFGKNLFPAGSQYKSGYLHWVLRDRVFKGQNPVNQQGWDLLADLKKAIDWMKTQAFHPNDSTKRATEILTDDRLELTTSVDEVIEHAVDTIKFIAEPTLWKGKRYHQYDMSDMQWKPFVHGWGEGICDELYVDEGQDINPIRVKLIELWMSDFVGIVGDAQQAIYQFNGSMSAALSMFKKQFNATEYPLTTCWRCPSSHLELAREIVPDIQDRPNCPTGTVNYQDHIDDLSIDQNGILILSRTNAPLIRNFYRLRKQSDRQVVLMSGDVVNTLCNMIGSEYQQNVKIDAQWHQRYEAKLEKRKKYCKTPSSMALLEDNDEQVQMILSEYNPSTVGEAHDKIREDFSLPEIIDGDAIRMCSAHASKGLEHPHVCIFGSSNFPHPKAELAWERESESNLLYVARTRCLASDDITNSGILDIIPEAE